MKALLLAAAAAAAALAASPAAGGRNRPHVLTVVADIGTVYWRAECPRHEVPRWSLGVLISQRASSTGITFRAGSLILRREVNVPDGTTRWFPFRRNRIQRLVLESGSEGGNHVASLEANFADADRAGWQAPDITLRTYVRH